MESARPAAEADLEDLGLLWEQAVAELDGQRGGSGLAGSLAKDDLGGFLRAALVDPDRLLIIGQIDQTAVGVASLRADRDRPQPIGQLELIYVEPNARQVGVGEAMLSAAVDWCEAREMTGLDAPALPGNRSAKSFFEQQGMQARLLTMHRPIGGTAHG